LPPGLNPVVERIEENCEPALTSVIFMAGAGGSLRAGVTDYRLPETAIPLPGPALPGPGQDDVASAADMTPEQRTQMIQGMVARLSDRLATEGGTPQEWARLIGAYGVLNNQAQAIAIWDNAKEVFAGDEEALKIVREGAANAGIAQ